MEENTWYPFTKGNVSELKEGHIGVYIISDINRVPVYIGSSTSPRMSIRGRLLSHLRNRRCPKGKYFLCTLARGLQNPEQMEAQAVFRHMRKYRKLPIYVKAFPRLYKLD